MTRPDEPASGADAAEEPATDAADRLNGPGPYEPPATTPVPASPPLSREPATTGDRINAWVIDRGLSLSTFAIGCFAGSVFFPSNPGGSKPPMALVLLATFGPLVALAALQTWRLATTGQTIGRQVHGVCVVHERGEPANQAVLVLQALLRTAARHLTLFGALWFLSHIIPGHPDGGVVDYAAEAEKAARGRWIGLGLLVAGAGPLLLDVLDLHNGQALHDRLFRTRVVRGPSATSAPLMQ